MALLKSKYKLANERNDLVRSLLLNAETLFCSDPFCISCIASMHCSQAWLQKLKKYDFVVFGDGRKGDGSRGWQLFLNVCSFWKM